MDKYIPTAEYATKTYVTVLLIRLALRYKYRAYIFTLPHCEIFSALFVAQFHLGRQNAKILEQQEKLNLFHIQQKEDQEKAALRQTQLKENMRYWTNSQYWH